MADVTPQKRVLPARERRESTAKRRASSPTIQKSPTMKTTPLHPASETRQKRKYTKRASLVKNATPARSTSTPVSVREDNLPTKIAQSEALPTSQIKQASTVSSQDYQSIADSAILTASLHRSRMQWLCDGVLQKYWTKPVKKKGVVDVPPNNPDAKSMQKLGNATITIEPHTFEATLFTVRDPTSVVPAYYRHPNQHTVKQGPPPPLPTPPAPYAVYQPPSTTPRPSPQSLSSQIPATRPTPPPVKKENTPSQALAAPPSSTNKTIPPPAGSTSAAQNSKRPPTPPGGAKTTDPVIQMLAARAASDNRLKDLMKVVATSRATAEQLREFQAHIDEFNSIVKRQEEERERQKQQQLSTSTTTSSRPNDRDVKNPVSSSAQTPAPAAAHPAAYGTNSARGPLPLPPYVAYPAPPPPPPRVEPVIKHIVIEFNSAASSTQPASSDRWLFPEHAVLDMRYGGMEMTCSFLVEKKGADLLAVAKAQDEREGGFSGPKWEADKEYYQPVTMMIKATQHRTIETIARSAKSLADVQNYMKEVMEKKVRAPQEYLILRLPREKAAIDCKQNDFVDSAIELSAEEDDDLKDFYGVG